MIEKITLKNFQQHSRLSLNISPQVTTLVGDSRSGKSSVLRALWFLAQGGKSTGYIKHREESFKISLYLDNHRVTRRKGKSENSYKLDDKEEFRAVHSSVPPEIAGLLGVSDINFQGQLDPPFWLSLSPAEAARELNKVVSLDLIDTTLAKLVSNLRKTSTQEELIKKRVEGLESKLISLSWVPHAQASLESIEQLEIGISSDRARIVSMATLVQVGTSLESKLEDASEAILEAAKLKESLEGLTILVERESRLSKLIKEYQQVKESRDTCEVELEEVQRELNTLREKSCPLCGR